MQNIFNFLRKNDIGNPPWDYYFLQNLDEKEYPRYLAKLFKLNTGENLPLKYDFKLKNWVIDKNKCKTFNQKIQWIKLYGVTNLMRDCTDKIQVRYYVKEKIGEEYLKPVLQICDKFDEIDFEKLPNGFVMKQYIIKDKENFLNNKKLFSAVRQQMTGWLEQNFCWWGGFEMQYKGIEPKIIIEQFLGNKKENAQEIEAFCFNGKPKLIKKVHNDIPNKISMYDDNLNNIDFKFLDKEFLVKAKGNDLINQSFVFSEQLVKDFDFVRVDWMICNNKIYFNELTFTPNSGLIKFDKKWNKKLGSWLNLEIGEN